MDSEESEDLFSELPLPTRMLKSLLSMTHSWILTTLSTCLSTTPAMEDSKEMLRKLMEVSKSMDRKSLSIQRLTLLISSGDQLELTMLLKALVSLLRKRKLIYI
jgi:hypothetical protein